MKEKSLFHVMCSKLTTWKQTRSRNVVRRCSSKEVFLKVMQISQENTYVGVSYIKRRHTSVFLPVKFSKFLRTPLSKENLWWLFLTWQKSVLEKKEYSNVIPNPASKNSRTISSNSRNCCI